MQVN